MVPIVSSVAQAKAVLDAAKYWPDGTRGVALGLAHERFAMRSEPLLDRFAEQNARTVVILQVEDPRGADAAGEIAALPGVDMLWLGHNDLSVAMNKPGAFDHPDFLKHESDSIAAAQQARQVGRPARRRCAAGRGVREARLRFRGDRRRRLAACSRPSPPAWRRSAKASVLVFRTAGFSPFRVSELEARGPEEHEPDPAYARIITGSERMPRMKFE